jgi:hypothetical protein
VIEIAALHESAHIVVAGKVGVKVVAVSIAADDAYVRTRHRRARTRAQAIDTLQRLVLVDLAGAVIEPVPGAASDDLSNAERRIAEIIRLRHGDEVDAARLRRSLRARAETLVQDSLPEIMQMAAALAAGDARALRFA